MPQFYRKKGDQTIYRTYDPKTGAFGGGITGGEQKAQKLGVIPDWEASWKAKGAATNIQTIEDMALKTPSGLSVGEAEKLSKQQPQNKVKTILYTDLENRSGTIFNKATGRAYGEGVTEEEAQAQLAADLGVQPHEIDWAKILPKTAPGGDEDATGALGAGAGEEGKDYRDLVLKALTDYLAAAGKQKSLKDIYTEESEELGIPGQKKLLAGIQQQALDVEGLLDDLEADITGRVKGKMVTEAQRRRMLAAEQKPLVEQLTDLMRAEARARTGLEGSRGELATLMGLEEAERAGAKEKLELLPYWKEAYEYEEPETREEKTRREYEELVAKEEAKAKIEEKYREPEKPEIKSGGGGSIWERQEDGTWKMVAGPIFKPESKDETGLDKTQKAIISDIEGSLSSYKINPEGFREKLINTLVGRYDSQYRNFITDNVYTVLPDAPKEELTEEEKFNKDFQDGIAAVQSGSIKKKEAKKRLISQYPDKAKQIEEAWEAIFGGWF